MQSFVTLTTAKWCSPLATTYSFSIPEFTLTILRYGINSACDHTPKIVHPRAERAHIQIRWRLMYAVEQTGRLRLLQSNTKQLSGICKRREKMDLNKMTGSNFLETPFLLPRHSSESHWTAFFTLRSQQNLTWIRSAHMNGYAFHQIRKLNDRCLRWKLNIFAPIHVTPTLNCLAARQTCVAKNRFSIPCKWNAPNKSSFVEFIFPCARRGVAERFPYLPEGSSHFVRLALKSFDSLNKS